MENFEMLAESSRARSNFKILIAITFHFREERLAILAQVLRSLSIWPVSFMRVVLFVNEIGQENFQKLSDLCVESLGSCRFDVKITGNLKDRWRLTWAHKSLIGKEFLKCDSEYSHFIYLEDDIDLRFENFTYWIEGRSALKPLGLLPSFLRTEYRYSEASWTSSDVFWSVYLPAQSYLHIDNITWVSMPNPYNPFFILDLDLASEYVQSASFDEERSSFVTWGLAERAAMGLCNENVPTGFPHRYVIPITRSGFPVKSCEVFHIPSNYAQDNVSPLGKVRLKSMFVGTQELMPPEPTQVFTDERSQRYLASKDNDSAKSIGQLPCFSCSRPAWTEIIEVPVLLSDIEELFVPISHHDTVMYYDPDRRRIIHNTFGVASLNLFVRILGDQASFLYLSGPKPVSEPTYLPSAAVISEGESVKCDRYSDGTGTFSFQNNTGLLSAKLGGGAAWDASRCLQWERFRLIRADTLIGLAWLRREAWLDDRGRPFIWVDQPFDFGRTLHSEASALAATIAPNELNARRDIYIGRSHITLSRYDTPFFRFDNIMNPATIMLLQNGRESESFYRKSSELD